MRIWSTAKGLVLVLITALVMLGAVKLGWISPFAPTTSTDVGLTVVESIRELSTLTAVEQVQYTTVEQTKQGGFLGPLRSDSVFLFAVARIGAGVDLSAIAQSDIRVDRQRQSVHLVLPAPTLQYVAMDNEATRVYNRDTGIFASADKTLETQARQAAEEALRQKALASGILDRAAENAVRALSIFLRSLGYQQVEIVVRSD